MGPFMVIVYVVIGVLFVALVVTAVQGYREAERERQAFNALLVAQADEHRRWYAALHRARGMLDHIRASGREVTHDRLQDVLVRAALSDLEDRRADGQSVEETAAGCVRTMRALLAQYGEVAA